MVFDIGQSKVKTGGGGGTSYEHDKSFSILSSRFRRSFQTGRPPYLRASPELLPVRGRDATVPVDDARPVWTDLEPRRVFLLPPGPPPSPIAARPPRVDARIRPVSDRGPMLTIFPGRRSCRRRKRWQVFAFYLVRIPSPPPTSLLLRNGHDRTQNVSSTRAFYGFAVSDSYSLVSEHCRPSTVIGNQRDDWVPFKLKKVDLVQSVLCGPGKIVFILPRFRLAQFENRYLKKVASKKR